MVTGNFSEQSWENEILTQITEGMYVYDKSGEKIGDVEFVQLGSYSTTGSGAATTEGSGDLTSDLADRFIEAFASTDQIPNEVRERLLYYGFIRVNSSRLLASDRYIVPEHIERVKDNRVYLRTRYEDLISRSS